MCTGWGCSLVSSGLALGGVGVGVSLHCWGGGGWGQFALLEGGGGKRIGGQFGMFFFGGGGLSGLLWLGDWGAVWSVVVVFVCSVLV